MERHSLKLAGTICPLSPETAFTSDPQVMSYQHDPILDRPLSLTYPSPTIGSNSPTHLTYHYDLAGNEMGRLTRLRDEVLAIDLVSQIDYGPGNQITAYHYPGGTQQVQVALDNINRIRTQTFTTAQDTHERTYFYDYRGLLAKIDNPEGTSYEYAYDSLGQIQSAIINGLDTNQNPATLFNFTYTFDPFGNLTQRTDSVGTTIPDIHLSSWSNNQYSGFSYNTWGELTLPLSVERPVS